MSYLNEEITDKNYGLKFLFMGLAQTGKSSIIQVVFENMHPQETEKLPATMKLKREIFDFSGYTLNVYDTAGQISYLEEVFVELRESIFSYLKALFYVVDVSSFDDLDLAKSYFSKAIKNVNEYSKEAEIRILAHKMDLIEPEKREIIINKISNLFGVDEYENVKVYETSIFEDTLLKAIKSVL